MDTVNPSAKTEQPFSPEDCWFCKVSKAPKIEPHIKFEMYRRGALISEEKDSKGVKEQKYQWDTIKFPVPRCEECQHVHSSGPALRTVPTLLVFIGFVAGLYNVYNKYGLEDGLEYYLEVSVCAFIGFIVAESYSRWAIKRLKKNIPDEKYGRYYPVLDKLVTDGWVIGTSPASRGGTDPKALVTQKQNTSKYFPTS